MYAKAHKVRGRPKATAQYVGCAAQIRQRQRLTASMGLEFFAACPKMKHQEGDSFVSHFSSWKKGITPDN
jgi:glutamate---methylamine ligase